LKTGGRESESRIRCRNLEENGGRIAVQAIGAAAVSQAVKGIAIARAMAAPGGADLKVVPGFKDVELNGRKITAMQMHVLWC
jgi:stage V sporulation protein S